MATRRALVVFVSCLAGLVAAASGAAPTGQRTTDRFLDFLLVAAVTWLGATCPWWMFVGAGAVTALLTGRSTWTLLALIAVALGIARRWPRRQQPWLGAVASGAIAVSLLHIGDDPFFGASAIAAGVVATAMAIVGLFWRDRVARLTGLGVAVGLLLVALLATGGIALATFNARGDLQHGYDTLNDGLDHLRDGNSAAAAASLHAATGNLTSAARELDSFWARPAALVPVIAQHREALRSIVDQAAIAASSAATALDSIDLDRLRVVDGTVDVDALAALAEPLNALDTAVREMDAVLASTDSPWLVAPARREIGKARKQLATAIVQSSGTAQAATYGPALLGRDGRRVYLVVFTSPGRARALSGVISNWAQVDIDDGHISQTASGRTADLIAPAEGVTIESWTSALSTPDWPAEASSIADLYATSGHTRPDGVLMIDPTGIAALLRVAGPITIEQLDRQVDADQLLQFLEVDQYSLPDAVRRPVAEAVAGAALQQFLTASLPSPSEFAKDLGAAATEGHITAWTRDPDEERLFRSVGMSGQFPDPSQRGIRTDGLAVVTNNASGREIDTFLHRAIAYDATFDRTSGDVSATVTVSLDNTAPSGISRTSLTVYSPLAVKSWSVDGRPVAAKMGTANGWQTSSAVVPVDADGTATVTIALHGALPSGAYALQWWPQPVTSPDSVELKVTDSDGRRLIDRAGAIQRLSLVDGDGLHPIR